MRPFLIVSVVLLAVMAFVLAIQTVPAGIGAKVAQNATAQAAEFQAAHKSAQADLEAEISALKTGTKGLEDQVAQARAQLQQTSAQEETLLAANAELTQQLATQQASLTQAQTARGENDAAAQTYKTQLAAIRQDAKTLNAQLSKVKQTAQEQTAQIARQSAVIAQAEDRIASLTAASATAAQNGTAQNVQTSGLTVQVAALKAQVADLVSTVSARDLTIEELRTSTPEPAVMTAAMCSDQTAALFADQKINFETGTARVTAQSLPALTRLSGLALECANSALVLDIGGHTDSQGGETSNKKLSERRANTVQEFLELHGVPATALSVTGHGESQPIADNATREGRSANRRITLEWQQPLLVLN